MFDFKTVKTRFLECVSRHPLPVYAFCLFVVFFVLYSQSFHFRIGDQFCYAEDIETGRSVSKAEPGHLLLRPLGWLVYTTFQAFGYSGRAVTVLQLISAFFGAVGVGGLFYLAYNLVKDAKVALFAASVLALSHSYWAYSGNGCAYVPCTSIMIFAFVLLFKLPGFVSYRQMVLCVLGVASISALSALFWLPQVLSFPALTIGILLVARGVDFGKRFSLAVLYSVAVLFLLFMPILLSLIVFNECRSTGDLLSALKSPSHGIPVRFSVMNFFRIIYGAAKAFVAIPDMGSAVRGIITGEFSLLGARLFLDMGKFLLVWAVCLLTVGYLVVRWRGFEGNSRVSLIILGTWILPFFCFGMGFLGSDLERLLPALPAAVLVLFITLSHVLKNTSLRPSRLRLVRAVSIVLFATMVFWNFSGFFVPQRGIADDKDWKMAESLGRKMRPDDMVITWGLDMQGVGKFLFYYAYRKCVDLNTDIMVAGAEGWRERLEERIRDSFAKGGRVFMHDRLILEKDVPESRWSVKEHPHPDRQELRAFFLQYRKSLAWIIEGEIFWEIRGS